MSMGVSEVLGVIMMLAMVLSIMGGIWIFLNPYISDFEDNTNWNSANGIADRIEDRVEVVGDAPEGTGARQNVALKTSIFTRCIKYRAMGIQCGFNSLRCYLYYYG